MTEDIYTNGSATLGSPSHSNGREVRKIRLVQFEKVTEEPMVSAAKIPKPGGTERGGGAGRAVPVGWPWGKQDIAQPQGEGAGCCLLPGTCGRCLCQEELMLLGARELSPPASSHGFSCLPGNHAEAERQAELHGGQDLPRGHDSQTR